MRIVKGKTNVKYILIVSILTIVAGLWSMWFSRQEIAEIARLIQEKLSHRIVKEEMLREDACVACKEANPYCFSCCDDVCIIKE